MANLLIRPTTGSGNKLIIQDQDGGDILTSSDNGATIENVDKLEVGANNTDYGAKINQAGTGDILQLQDNGTDVLIVKDGGDISTGTTNKIKQKGAFMQSSTHQSWVMGG